MKKHFKKLLIVLLTAVCTMCLAFGLAACGDKTEVDNGPTPLEAPMLDISGTILSWNSVEHATGYQVWENGTRKADLTETSYNIPATTLAVPGTYRYTVKAISSDSDYTDSPMSNERTYIVNFKATALAAPVIFIESYSGLLTWDRVENADGYYVFENGKRITNVRLTTTSYTVSKKSVAGDYEYTVQAISNDSRFSESPMSEPVVLTVESLEAPVITIDEENAVIYWNEVANAESYVVYADGSRVTETTGTSYEITQIPGDHRFAVAAVSSAVKYAAGQSEAQTYNVPLIATINFEIPADFNAQNVTAVLCGGEVEEDYEIADFGNSIRMVAHDGDVENYTVKLKGLPEEYVSTWAHVSEDSLTGTITILKRGENELKVGIQTLTQTLTGADGVLTSSGQYIFIAGTTEAGDGIHSIELQASNYTDKSMTVSVNGVGIIDTSRGMYVDNFTAQDGEALIITFEFEKQVAEGSATASEEVSFEFNIVAEEIKQYLNVLSEEYNPDAEPDSEQAKEQQATVNYLAGTCNRYINLEEDTSFTLLFLTSTVGDRTITVTVGGERQTLVSGGKVTFNVAAGTDIKIEIKVTGSGYSGQEIISFWIYPTPETENAQ